MIIQPNLPNLNAAPLIFFLLPTIKHRIGSPLANVKETTAAPINALKADLEINDNNDNIAHTSIDKNNAFLGIVYSSIELTSVHKCANGKPPSLAKAYVLLDAVVKDPILWNNTVPIIKQAIKKEIIYDSVDNLKIKSIGIIFGVSSNKTSSSGKMVKIGMINIIPVTVAINTALTAPLGTFFSGFLTSSVMENNIPYPVKVNEELCKPIIKANGSGQPLLELSKFVKISLIEFVLLAKN